MGKSLILN